MMASDLALPKQLLVHGWIKVDKQKMSKSLGNVIDPIVLKDTYGAQEVRYYLMRYIAVTQDSNFSTEDLERSITSDLANELIYRYPDRVILIAREKNGDMKCSVRASKINLIPIIEKCLIGLNGYGGGHEHACGLNVKKDDFEEFLRRFREMI